MKTLFFLFFIWSIAAPSVKAQSKSTYEFKRGEVLDISFFISRGDVNRDSLFGIYREVLFPMAKEFSFQPLPGFAIKKTLQGGHQPSYLALGKWRDVIQRVRFIDEVLERVPAFHDMRRGLWHSFALTYYEMKEDVSFTLNPGKYKVASAIWLNAPRAKGKKFVREWMVLCKSYGGELVLQLDEGSSPSGYYFNPDSFMITEWASQAEYDKFAEAVNAMDDPMIQNINEFQI